MPVIVSPAPLSSAPALARVSSQAISAYESLLHGDYASHLADWTSERTWCQRLADPACRVLAAFEDGRVCGTVYVRADAQPHAADGYVGGLYVPVARRGAGRALLTAARRQAGQMGLTRLLAETAENNEPALACFAADGWRPAGFWDGGRVFLGVRWTELLVDL